MLSRIDPKVDFAFKWLFGREQTLPLLVDFLNAVLNTPPDQEIVWLELLNPFNEKDSADDKLSIVDLKARDRSGRLFDVEMQLLAEPYFTKRILYYWARLHQQQLGSGETYNNLSPTISVCVTNFVLFPQTNEYNLHFELHNRKCDLVFSSDILVIVLELPKFRLPAEKISKQLEAWLYFLCHAEKLDIDYLPTSLEKPEIITALQELNMLSQDDIERERYEARMRVLRDEKSRQLYYQTAEEEAMRKGLERGLEQGLEQGRRDEAFNLVLRQLSKRFGVLDPGFQSRLQKLDLECLEELSEAILDFEKLEDCEIWLDKDPGPN